MSESFGISAEILLICYTTRYSAVVASSFCKPKGVCLGSMSVKMKAVIKSMMYHCRYKHSNYLDSKGYHYSYSEVVCSSSAYANSLMLMLGFSNGWGICHDMGFLAWGNVHGSSNIWFQMPRPGWSRLFTDILRPLRASERFATSARSMTEAESNPDNYLHVKLACQDKYICLWMC